MAVHNLDTAVADEFTAGQVSHDEKGLPELRARPVATVLARLLLAVLPELGQLRTAASSPPSSVWTHSKGRSSRGHAHTAHQSQRHAQSRVTLDKGPLPLVRYLTSNTVAPGGHSFSSRRRSLLSLGNPTGTSKLPGTRCVPSG